MAAGPASGSASLGLPGQRGLASDARSLDSLRHAAAADPRSAAREAARQFEALFTAELLKSMRAASQGGLMDNEASQMGQQMLDTQLSTQLAGRPGGLAEVIARQLERQMGLAPGPIPPTAKAAAALPLNDTPRIPSVSAAAFVQQHTGAAQAAEAATGIPAAFMLAQAAHETGWGRKAIVGQDGTASNNLFGIKAGPGWKGPTVDVATTEYVGGVPQRLVQRFRAYASEAESFADYARLMKDSPRYAGVVAAGRDGQGAAAFAQGLQKAGYATDPAYADKLGRVIHTTLQLQRAQRS